MESFLRKLYLYKFIDAFTLIFPVFTLLFQKAGLNTVQIALLILVWSITQLISEIPGGILADKYSRKKVLAIANICRAICFCFWLGGGFWWFALGFIFWGIKNGLAGGTFEALVFDELKAMGKEHLYEKINGTSEGWRFAGVALSAILGGFVAQYSFFWALVLSIVSAVIAATMVLSVKSVKQYEERENNSYLHLLKGAFRHLKTNIPLLLTVIIICFIFATYSATDEFWALIYNKFGLSVGIIGTLIAGGYGLTSLAGYTAHYFKSTRFKNIEYLFIIASGVLLFTVGIGKQLIFIPLVFVAIYLLQIANIKIEARLQHQIASNQRATIFSIKSFFYELVYMFFVFILGFLADKIGVITVLAISGSVIVLGTLAFGYIENLLEKSHPL
jgi:MFS family permease